MTLTDPVRELTAVVAECRREHLHHPQPLVGVFAACGVGVQEHRALLDQAFRHHRQRLARRAYLQPIFSLINLGREGPLGEHRRVEVLPVVPGRAHRWKGGSRSEFPELGFKVDIFRGQHLQ